MTLRNVKRIVRQIVSRLGLWRDPSGGSRSGSLAGSEMPDFYYDAAFHKDPSFRVPFYRSSYYPTWLVVVDRLHRYGCTSILDVGCGPGQFAALIGDSGFRSYTGLDFSPVAIQMAHARTPQFHFRAGDVRQKTTYEGLAFDAIVCMEVLEHIEEDFAVLSCFRPGTRCLMTVPNFPWRSHVRHFESEEAVRRRYAEFFEELSVTRLKGVRSDTEQFYLLDGVRNTLVRHASESPQSC